MANCDNNDQWQTCESSRRRDFVYRPNSPTPILRPQTSNSYRNSYALPDPLGVTAYSEDFCWKPPSKPECIRSGTASGTRRNNPHPSQTFMVWKLPPGVKIWENSPSQVEIRNALSAQYKSTYRSDFLGLPQGLMLNHRGASPLKRGHEAQQAFHTEMSSNYRKPVQNAELRGNVSRYGCNALHGVTPRGIVPTVVPKHISNPESRKHLTTYDQHFGGRSTESLSVFSSLQPQELHSFYKHLSEKEKTKVQTFLQRPPSLLAQRKKVKNSVKFSPPSPTLERTSTWSGPL